MTSDKISFDKIVLSLRKLYEAGLGEARHGKPQIVHHEQLPATEHSLFYRSILDYKWDSIVFAVINFKGSRAGDKSCVLIIAPSQGLTFIDNPIDTPRVLPYHQRT